MKVSDVLEDIAIGATAVTGYGVAYEPSNWPVVAFASGLVAAVCFGVSAQLAKQGQ